MNTEVQKDGDPLAHPITIVLFNGRYFLVRGEEYMSNLLSGMGEYPVPVAILSMSSFAKFQTVLPKDKEVTDLWNINARIIERLRVDEQLLEIDIEA